MGSFPYLETFDFSQFTECQDKTEAVLYPRTVTRCCCLYEVLSSRSISCRKGFISNQAEEVGSRRSDKLPVRGSGLGKSAIETTWRHCPQSLLSVATACR